LIAKARGEEDDNNKNNNNKINNDKKERRLDKKEIFGSGGFRMYMKYQRISNPLPI
jgi:hypothetical protein